MHSTACRKLSGPKRRPNEWPWYKTIVASARQMLTYPSASRARARARKLHLVADRLQRLRGHVTTGEQQATHVTLALGLRLLRFAAIFGCSTAPSACGRAFCSNTRTIVSGAGLLCFEHSHSSDCVFSSPLPTFCCLGLIFAPWHHILGSRPRT